MVNHIKHLTRLARRKILNKAKWFIGIMYLTLGTPGFRSHIIAFVFHEIGNSPREHARLTNTYCTNEIFSKQIDLLIKNFKFIDPRNNTNWVDLTGCLLTFDDGYLGALEAAKTLEVLEIPSIHFVNLETIYGQFNSSALSHFKSLKSEGDFNWFKSTPLIMERTLLHLSSSDRDDLQEFSGPYMNPVQLSELNSLEYTTLGDHFLNHWYAESLTDTETLENISRNAEGFTEKSLIQPFFAAPHGSISNRKIELISKQGYDVFFSGTSWMKIANSCVIPRIDMNNSISSKASLFGAIAILVLRSKRKSKRLR
jgi:hypothetical protein